ncbi:ATP-binding protein [Gilvimarinus sp. SDUM040013]|uniref:histidine kinase n=1 Tax=Gilvimarinus gilvus TaxID=3058038 RepID=A0ABU4S2U9_9GAMM|nr:ATP-binding protein [Gilvimarinus sp. SDUM040013]MDO3384979.1 ATP-binding protein [Gilvimarinus sp. SDUM040013]MDX6851500.1 ATP-binding protein [Gilvimarinus sp. SDUM040013]
MKIFALGKTLVRLLWGWLLLIISDISIASDSELSDQRWLWSIILVMVALQSVLIVGLQRSRIKITHARQALFESQKALEEKVRERTESLHITNDQLYQEIGRHEATELLLRETQEYLHSILNSMPSVIIGVTHKGFITHWNAAAEDKCGILASNALQQHILQAYPTLPIQATTIAQTIEAGEPYITQNFQETVAGETKYCDLTIYPLIAAQAIGAVIRIDDVTMRVRVENMMIQNEKMASLGELAAGMAHEINNPLSTILHGVQNVFRRTSPDLKANRTAAEQLDIDLDKIEQYLNKRKVTQFLEDIREAGERSADIVTNMLDFSRNSKQTKQPYDLAQVIRHGVDLLNAEPVAMPAIALDLTEDLPNLYGCAAEIQQVLLNLVRNAAQAFGKNPSEESRIFITLSKVQNSAILSVKDNGPGMTDEVARHVFEPFFTTKDIGQGTGLGLSVSYFIITEHHGGTISVESTLGEGTEFLITLPLPTEASANVVP